LLGAIGGATAGYAGGKHFGHGILGLIGGAIAGSKLEDEVKKHNHKPQQGGSQYGGSGSGW